MSITGALRDTLPSLSIRQRIEFFCAFCESGSEQPNQFKVLWMVHQIGFFSSNHQTCRLLHLGQVDFFWLLQQVFISIPYIGLLLHRNDRFQNSIATIIIRHPTLDCIQPALINFVFGQLTSPGLFMQFFHLESLLNPGFAATTVARKIPA